MIEAFRYAFASGLFWDEVGHGIFASLFSFFIYKKSGRFKLALIPLIMAYALDVDHLIDYWDYYGFGFDPLRFVRLEYFYGPGRAFIPLHAWEWAGILTFFSIKKGWNSYATAINLGLITHLAWDSFTIQNVIFYSITYRWLTGFRIFL